MTESGRVPAWRLRGVLLALAMMTAVDSDESQHSRDSVSSNDIQDEMQLTCAVHNRTPLKSQVVNFPDAKQKYKMVLRSLGFLHWEIGKLDDAIKYTDESLAVVCEFYRVYDNDD